MSPEDIIIILIGVFVLFIGIHIMRVSWDNLQRIKRLQARAENGERPTIAEIQDRVPMFTIEAFQKTLHTIFTW